MEDTEAMDGEELEMKYVPLSDTHDWDWIDNPKSHDTDALIESIVKYGFKDPPKYEPELDAFGHGNGRTYALREIKERGMSPPRGVLTKGGEWYVPVLFGVNAESQEVAEAYAVDHNNLTMAGGDFTAEDIARMWDHDEYVSLIERMGTENVVTVSPEDLEDLTWEEDDDIDDAFDDLLDDGDFDDADLVFVVETTADTTDERDEIVDLLKRHGYTCTTTSRKV